MQNLKSLEDDMQAALKGDGLAYARALKTIAGELRGFITGRIRKIEDADDIIQEILISIHKARHTYDGNRPLLPWVYAIARYRLTDYLRQRYSVLERGRVSSEDLENILTNDVTESAIDNEYIKKEVAKLKGKQPKIIELMHYQGFTAKETAAKMGMKESAVKVAAHRAYKILQKRIKGHGGN